MNKIILTLFFMLICLLASSQIPYQNEHYLLDSTVVVFVNQNNSSFANVKYHYDNKSRIKRIIYSDNDVIYEYGIDKYCVYSYNKSSKEYNYKIEYLSDLNDNLIRINRYGFIGSPKNEFVLSSITDYIYDENNRLLEETKFSKQDPLNDQFTPTSSIENKYVNDLLIEQKIVSFQYNGDTLRTCDLSYSYNADKQNIEKKIVCAYQDSPLGNLHVIGYEYDNANLVLEKEEMFYGEDFQHLSFSKTKVYEYDNPFIYEEEYELDIETNETKLLKISTKKLSENPFFEYDSTYRGSPQAGVNIETTEENTLDISDIDLFQTRESRISLVNQIFFSTRVAKSFYRRIQEAPNGSMNYLDFKIFPNPCRVGNNIRFETSDSNYNLIEIIGEDGRLISRNSIEPRGINHIISPSVSGIYYIRLWKNDIPRSRFVKIIII